MKLLFTCDKCNYYTGRKNDLTKHQRVHDQLRPFVCPDCSKTYKQNSHLRVHRRRAHDPRRKGLKLRQALIETGRAPVSQASRALIKLAQN